MQLQAIYDNSEYSTPHVPAEDENWNDDRWLHVCSEGDITVVLEGGHEKTFADGQLAVGVIHPILCRGVKSSTAATVAFPLRGV